MSQQITLNGNNLNPSQVKKTGNKRNSEINYTINGTAWITNQTVNSKNVFFMRYKACSESEKNTLRSLFDTGGEQTLVWEDGNSYNVIWPAEFTLDTRLKGSRGYWSGNVVLYEV